ncbi:MAG TPA: serine hydrolase [Acidimicrobiales bacterium]|jgi:CubicO group peptidase (beta-lactamase class C family)|nr:serine hydrolase [Acidimicrobiales bacterium]
MSETPANARPSSAPQPDGVAWPTGAWPEGEATDAVDALVDRAFTDPELAETYAVVVVQHGRIVAERYGGALPSFTHAPTPVTATTPLLSWSIAKSVLHAAVGILVGQGRLDLDAPARIAAWSELGDPRRAITLRQLLQMRDGLAWTEDYVDDSISDVIEMLFGSGKTDVAAFAAAHELAHDPGTTFNYSSGTSNLIASIVGDVVGRGDDTVRFLADSLFGPLGMHDARITCDDVGTFVGSSYVYCSARSFAKFATLYLRGGEWDGARLLDAAWVADAQVPVSQDTTVANTYYSHHWWLDAQGTFWASGYEGQRAVVCPARDCVVVRLGHTPAVGYPALRSWCDSMVAALD